MDKLLGGNKRSITTRVKIDKYFTGKLNYLNQILASLNKLVKKMEIEITFNFALFWEFQTKILSVNAAVKGN